MTTAHDENCDCSTCAEKRRRIAGEKLDQLARAALVVDVDGNRVNEKPGLYVRLFGAVQPGASLGVVGGRARGKREGSPANARLDVMDVIDEIAQFAFTTEKWGRQISGEEPVERTDTAADRHRWGLEPVADRLYAGVVPDVRVLDSLAWLQTHYDPLDADPDYGVSIAAEIGDLVGHARGALDLTGVGTNQASCPFCGFAAIGPDPRTPGRVYCMTVGCVDDFGRRPEWPDLGDWVAASYSDHATAA
jgi:hypothetical protein